MEPDSDLRPELTCGICRMALVAPATHVLCRNSFCRECVQSLLRADLAKCPICRGQMDELSLREDQSLIRELSAARIRCKCGEVFLYSGYNGHHDACDLVQKNIATAFESSKRPCGSTPNRWTFPCPECLEKNLDRQSLIEHVASEHPSLYTGCPICSAMPWGESDEDEGLSLAEHLSYRHRFDYDTFTVTSRQDFEKDEDEILEHVLQSSMDDF